MQYWKCLFKVIDSYEGSNIQRAIRLLTIDEKPRQGCFSWTLFFNNLCSLRSSVCQQPDAFFCHRHAQLTKAGALSEPLLTRCAASDPLLNTTNPGHWSGIRSADRQTSAEAEPVTCVSDFSPRLSRPGSWLTGWRTGWLTLTGAISFPNADYKIPRTRISGAAQDVVLHESPPRREINKSWSILWKLAVRPRDLNCTKQRLGERRSFKPHFWHPLRVFLKLLLHINQKNMVK